MSAVQVGAALAKSLFHVLGPGGAVMLRVGFAALVLLLVWRPHLRGYGWSRYRVALLLGGVLAAMNLSFYAALSRLPLGIAGTVEFVGPLAVAVFGSHRLLDVFWILLAAGGILLLAPVGVLSSATVDPTGLALALLAGALWAAYILLMVQVGQVFAGGEGLALAMGSAAVLLLPIGVILAGALLLNVPLLLAGAGVGLLSSVLPYSLEMEVLRRLPARVFGILMSLEPGVAALFGFVLLHEQLGLRALIAMLLVSTASVGRRALGRRQSRRDNLLRRGRPGEERKGSTAMPSTFPLRIPLATLPTPLQEAPRLRAALGGPARCPRLLIKRDDLTGLAFGGNKARKLEFLVADALAQGATTLVTSGAVQSNHARMTAAAARIVGLKVSLVLTSHVERPPMQGNLLLDHLLGTEIHLLPASTDPALAVAENETAKVAEMAAALEARGERPYVIPVGGSSAVGVLGYVAGTLELVGQLMALGEAPGWLYYASGSRGTQAGLTLGARLYSAPYQLCGVAVSGGEPDKIERALRIANEAAERLMMAVRLERAALAHTDQDYIGPGYGIPTEACLKAIRLVVRTEGIFLDPVYTGKAMVGLISHIRQGRIDPKEAVIFLHTGGTPALFAHAVPLSKTEEQNSRGG